MIMYHGSYTEVEKPELSYSRQHVDFGKGFYTTPIYDQAVNWSKRFVKQGKTAYVSVYEFDVQDLKTIKFDSYSEQWLDFVLACRSGRDRSSYDIVIGGVANDRVFNMVELYFDGLIDKGEALKRLKYEEPNLQICFRTEKALQCLRFLKSEIIQ